MSLLARSFYCQVVINYRNNAYRKTLRPHWLPVPVWCRIIPPQLLTPKDLARGRAEETFTR